MAKTETIQPAGSRLKKALQWVSDNSLEEPARNREDILREAESRFDLSPAECEFLNNNFN